MFTRSTPIGIIILAGGIIAISFFGIVTGQFLLIPDTFGFKARAISAATMVIGLMLLFYGINRL